MKRLLLFGGLLALGALPAAASAELVVGTGQSPTYPHAHVNAKDDGDGPRGHGFFAPPGLTPVQADVTCINVVGNTARVGLVGRQSGFPAFIEIIDNGSPGRGADQHRLRPALPAEVAPPDCNPTRPDFTPFEPLVQGNYVIKP
jgi:hypothetical protein